MNIRYLVSVLAISAMWLPCAAQVVTCSPQFPTVNDDNIVVTFDATKGTAGLKDYTGDVYAHTGVILSDNSSWVGAPSWGNNATKYKLTRTAANTYTLNIGNIKEYYGLTDAQAQKVVRLAFVFRSADCSREGKDDGAADIFCTVYEAGTLSISLTSPESTTAFVEAGQQLTVAGSTSVEAQIVISVDGNRVSSTIGTLFSADIEAAQSGTHIVGISATTSSDTATLSLTYTISAASPVATLPLALHRGVSPTADSSAVFTLYAPGKKSVYLIGSFNNWTPQADYLMNVSADGCYFFKQIDGLNPEQEYIYQYLVDERLRIADPYTEKVSDPANDKYIGSSVYPNLIEYPTGLTTGIASTFRLSGDNYQWKVDNFVKPDADNLTIYELLIRDFTTAGTIAAAEQRLDYLTELGIDAIELMPFNEFEGNDSWGYNPSFYFAPDKAYGTAADYKHFIDACHQRGIAVIQDMVLNHSFSQSPFVQLYFDESTSKVTAENPWYNIDSPNTTYYWGYDFNHESAETQKLVDSITTFWITNYKIDGFRFDFTKGFTNKSGDGWAYDASRIAILERIYDHIMSVDSSCYVICEHLTTAKEEQELAAYGLMLWGNMNNAFCQNVMGYSTDANLQNLSYAAAGFSVPRVGAYAESHDEERILYKAHTWGNSTNDYDASDLMTSFDRAKAAAVALLAVPGPKMIWQFGELGYDYSINYSAAAGAISNDYRTSRKPVPTNYLTDWERLDIYGYYKMMNQLRHQTEVFSSGSVKIEQRALLKTFYLSSATQNAVVVINFNLEKSDKTIELPHVGSWHELIANTTFNFTADTATISVEPGTARIFVDFETDITTGINYQNNDATICEPSLYPNPCNDYFIVKSPRSLNYVNLWSLDGRLVAHVEAHGSQNLQISTSAMGLGLYIVEVRTSNTTTNHKIFITR